MVAVPETLKEKLRRYGQEHVLAWWNELNYQQRETFLKQLNTIDLEQLHDLYLKRDQTFPLPARQRIQPVPVVRLGQHNADARNRGEEALRRGEVAVLIVAGGQGSRLNFNHPKGMFPIGPVSEKSLFQIHAEKVKALRRRYGQSIPLLVMTSPATHSESQKFFENHRHFDLPPGEVYFFCQGTMPALEISTGKLLLADRGILFASPNGHGGTITALAEQGLLDRLASRGIKQLFYFQVDNPLVKVADPIFLGHHLEAEAEVSSKVVAKESPADKLGNIVQVGGRCTIIEYSDLPADLGNQTDEQGRLVIWAGSPAIHLFSLAFLKRVTEGSTQVPFHVARKKVPYLSEAGILIEPKTENALKFEMFIFDFLPLADRWLVVETSCPEEFVPLKNASGADSPPVVRQAMSCLAADWLEHSGLAVPRMSNREPTYPLEISPLMALDPEELRARVPQDFIIKGPTYLE